MRGCRRVSRWVRRWIAALFAILLLPAGPSAWVPGTQGPILFSSLEGAATDPVGPHIWTVKPDGTGTRELTHGGDDWPAWSPSGRAFVFARQESLGGPVRSRLMVADNGGGSAHLLTDPVITGNSGDVVLGDSMPRWSPDGSHIAFVRSDLSGNNIWTMNADGSDQQQLTAFASTIAVQGLAWSPDSRKLVFSTGRPLGPFGDPSDGGGIYEMTAAGAGIHQVIPTGLHAPGVDWAPAGFMFGLNFEGISVVQLDGSGSPQTFGDAFPISPSWAPDATSSSNASLVYLAGGLTHTELVTTSTADPTQQELTFDGFAKESASWGPGLPHFNPSATDFTIRRPIELGNATVALLIHCPQSAGHAGCVDASWVRSHLFYRMGKLREAEADACAALDVAVDTHPGLVVLVARAFLADVLLERGQSQAALDAVAGFAPPPRSGGVVNHILHTRGRVLVDLGRPEEALADLLACGAGNDGIGAVNPGTIPWRSAVAEAMLARGDQAGGRRVAAEELARARRYGAPRSVGMALLAQGRCESGSRRLELLGGSVEILRNSGARLEYTRALIELGASLRRTNHRQAARGPLLEGLELARECGATVLERRAEEELRATGARARKLIYAGVDSLTASELRVARLAGGGQTNPEIAMALFVTRKTIEAHLSSTYAKLSISSRRELSQALSAV